MMHVKFSQLLSQLVVHDVGNPRDDQAGGLVSHSTQL